MHTPTIILAGSSFILMAQTVIPPEPDEAVKKQALILGYTLNGNSMVRPLEYGSIDVSQLLKGYRPTPAEIEFEKPAAPKKNSYSLGASTACGIGSFGGSGSALPS